MQVRNETGQETGSPTQGRGGSRELSSIGGGVVESQDLGKDHVQGGLELRRGRSSPKDDCKGAE
eukprot:618874-Pleurochrysis_carterae.AAC.2